jgi:uncharacterized protein with PQ loop repeat
VSDKALDERASEVHVDDMRTARGRRHGESENTSRRETMSTVQLPVAAGAVAAAIFAMSMLPMLVKAYRTKDLSSYSSGHIVLGNLGNVIYTVYVLHLPAGPIWVLHTFYTVSTALMLFWYLRYVRDGRRDPKRRPGALLRSVRYDGGRYSGAACARSGSLADRSEARAGLAPGDG